MLKQVKICINLSWPQQHLGPLNMTDPAEIHTDKGDANLPFATGNNYKFRPAFLCYIKIL